MTFRLIVGNSLNSAKTLEENSVDGLVTSPPYYRMRKYQCDEVWGGNPECDHQWAESDVKRTTGGSDTRSAKQQSSAGTQLDKVVGKQPVCLVCGAWYGELGWEETPEQYVAHLADIFDAIKPALKDTAVLWVNLGLSYASGGMGLGGNLEFIGEG